MPQLLTVNEALGLIEAEAHPLAAREVPLRDALGLRLAADVRSDVDSPPHDKAIVDGYAISAAEFARGTREFLVTETITAGLTPAGPIGTGQAARVMTGAPLPEGADAMIMVERTRAADNSGSVDRVFIDAERVDAGQNIMRRAASMRKGETVLRQGSVIRPIEAGLLAELGRTEIQAICRPRVAVVPTGNELVGVATVPGPGQIRNSNGPMLLALAQQCGAVGLDIGVGRDDAGQLCDTLARGLEADVLVISGGVSAGVLDLVPGVLVELGVRQVFHKVRLKPGKPLWFGVYHRAQTSVLVFGLPGNPVSSLVCFELFVRPAISVLSGRRPTGLERLQAALTAPYQHRGDRPTYHPAMLSECNGQPGVTPLRWQGSGDLRTLADATALAYFPAGDQEYPAGSLVETLVL